MALSKYDIKRDWSKEVTVIRSVVKRGQYSHRVVHSISKAKAPLVRQGWTVISGDCSRT